MKKTFLLAVISALLFTAAGASPPNVSKDVQAYAFIQSDDATVPSNQQIEMPALQPAYLVDSYLEIRPVAVTLLSYRNCNSIQKPSNIPLSAYKVNRMKNSK